MKSFRSAASLARDSEETAAATYLAAIPTFEGKDVIGLAGSIQVIDMQHVAYRQFHARRVSRAGRVRKDQEGRSRMIRVPTVASSAASPDRQDH